MARKAYALYAVFEEALRKELADEGEKPYGIIIHDRAFGLYANQLSDANILVIDDLMLFGRTVKDFVITLNEVFRIPYDKIKVCLFYVSDQLADPFLDKNRASVYIDENEGEYGHFCFERKEKQYCAFFRKPEIKDMHLIRGLSSRLIEAIHAMSKPYLAFIPNYTISLDAAINFGIFDGAKFTDARELKNYQITKDCLNSALTNKCDFYDISLHEQRSWYTSAICLVPKEELGSPFLFSCVRIYVSMLLRKVVIVPYVVFDTVTRKKGKETASQECNKLLQILHNINLSDKELEQKTVFQLEANFLRFCASYLYGLQFFSRINLNVRDWAVGFDKDLFDSSALKSDLNKFDVSGRINDFLALTDFFKVSRNVVSRSNQNELKELLVGTLKYFYNPQSLFIPLSIYFEQLVERDTPNNNRTERITGLFLKELVSIVVEKYNHLSETKIDERTVYVSMIVLTDAGRSVLRTDTIVDINRKYKGLFTPSPVTGVVANDGELSIQALAFFSMGLTHYISAIYKKIEDQTASNMPESSKKAIYEKAAVEWELHRDVIKEKVINYSKRKNPSAQKYIEKFLRPLIPESSKEHAPFRPVEYDLDSPLDISLYKGEEPEFYRELSILYIEFIEYINRNPQAEYSEKQLIFNNSSNDSFSMSSVFTASSSSVAVLYFSSIARVLSSSSTNRQVSEL